jgi:hypothetical protein
MDLKRMRSGDVAELFLASGSATPLAKAPEDWRTPRRFAIFERPGVLSVHFAAPLLDCLERRAV